MTRKRRKKALLVPRLVLGASFVGAVPACVAACGGPDPILDLGNQFGVAAVAFCCFDGGVAVDAFTFDVSRADVMDGSTGDSSDGASDAADSASDASDSSDSAAD